MKIALLFPNNLFTSPYLKYYTSVLEKEHTAYDLIIWDRENTPEPNCIAFRSEDFKKSKISKTLDFNRFRKFIIELLKKTEYSKIIVFTGQLGILLSDYLIKNYKKQYILDIRDYSKPMYYFQKRFKKVISNAQFVTISSNGFKGWLPPSDNYIVGHNIDNALIEKSLGKDTQNRGLFSNTVIQVDTIGQIKDFDSDHRFVDQLKNDVSFQMGFIGFGPTLRMLEEHADKENISNIAFHGAYKKEEEEDLLKETDVINILISLTEFNKGKTLLSNRLYLSALLRIPCIVNANSEQSRIIEKYGFGVIIDDYQELPSRLVAYRKTFQEAPFIENCRSFLRDVSSDYELFHSKLLTFLK